MNINKASPFRAMKGGLVLGPFSLASPCLEGDGEPISLSACLSGSLVGLRWSCSAGESKGSNPHHGHMRIKKDIHTHSVMLVCACLTSEKKCIECVCLS